MPRFVAPESDDDEYLDKSLDYDTQDVNLPVPDSATYYPDPTSEDVMDDLMEDLPFTAEYPPLVLHQPSLLSNIPNTSAYDKELNDFLTVLANTDINQHTAPVKVVSLPQIELFTHVPTEFREPLVSTHRHFVQTLMEVHLTQARPDVSLTELSFVTTAEDPNTFTPDESILSPTVRSLMARTAAQYPTDDFTQLCNNYFAAFYALSSSPAYSGNAQLHPDAYRTLRTGLTLFSLLKALFSARVTAECLLAPAAITSLASVDEPTRAFATDRARYNEVSRWCQFVISAHARSQLAAVARVQQDHSSTAHAAVLDQCTAAVIFIHLAAHQVTQAVTAAQRSSHPRLATLVAGAGSTAVRAEVSAQIKTWLRSGYWGDMDVWHRRVYALLAGQWHAHNLWGDAADTSLLEGVRSGGVAPLKIDERAPVEWWWVRAFALEVWYGGHSSVAEALQAYLQLANAGIVAQPHPVYMVGAPSRTPEAGAPVRDVHFLLLEAYVKGEGAEEIDLTAVLQPLAINPAGARDHALVWALADAVCAYYVAKSAREQLVRAQDALRLHATAFSGELCALRMWPWAVYVAMTAPATLHEKRESCLELLKQHLPAVSAFDHRRSRPSRDPHAWGERGRTARVSPMSPRAEAGAVLVGAVDAAGAVLEPRDLTLGAGTVESLYPSLCSPAHAEEADREAARELLLTALCAVSNAVLLEHAHAYTAIRAAPGATSVPVTTPAYAALQRDGLPRALVGDESVVTLAMDRFLCVACGVPVSWLHSTRAAMAYHAKKPMLQLAHLLLCSVVSEDEDEDAFVDTGAVDSELHREAFAIFLNTLAVSLAVNGHADDLYACGKTFFEAELTDMMDLTHLTQTAAEEDRVVNEEEVSAIVAKHPMEVTYGLIFRVLATRAGVVAAVGAGALSDEENSPSELLQLCSALEDIVADTLLVKGCLRHVILTVMLTNAEETARAALATVSEELAQRGCVLGDHGHTAALTTIEDMPYLDSVVSALNN